jgi:regulatory protein
MSEKIDGLTALSRARNICARQEQCKQDIREKLHRWGLPEEEVQVVISKLEEEGFIDEQRYAGMFIREKFRLNKWGRIKLRYMLKQKHIPETIIETSLGEIKEEEYIGLLAEELQKKMRTIKIHDKAVVHNQLVRFALQRGFEYEDIREALKRLT